MATDLESRILQHITHSRYRAVKARGLAKQLGLEGDENYGSFRAALKVLRDAGKIVVGDHTRIEPAPVGTPARGAGAAAPTAPSTLQAGVVIGSFRHHRKGFGFVMPTQPAGHEDLFIPEGSNATAITGDIVKAKVTGSDRREGKVRYEGRILEVLQRTRTRFVGSLTKVANNWVVLPDGNDLTAVIATPDAGSRHIKPGTKVVVELTTYPQGGQGAAGVIIEVLGEAGEKDVDLRGVIAQYGLPESFPESCLNEASAALQRFNDTLDNERRVRLDLTGEMVCTIDPDDAKDYDDAISLRRLDNGHWQLGVHIADVAFFVPTGSALDEEAETRGNSVYFPGHVIPMLPEVLSNGVCSLQGGVPRLCKSVFIELDAEAHPVGTKFANSIIQSRSRLRYREAQAILDGKVAIPHPDGDKAPGDYDTGVIELLKDMESLAKRIQKRRLSAGQLVLGLPEVDLVLDEEGKVIGAVPEDESYTHTMIEMFMVEANEAVARLLNGVDVPFLRRAHEPPPVESQERLRTFMAAAGYKLPKEIDRQAIQRLLESVKGKPEAFAINLGVLKSLSRAEYSPRDVGHYALASEEYAHFTSPIRRYADLTIHRLLDAYLAARDAKARKGDATSSSRKRKLEIEGQPTFEQLVELGRHLSDTERRGDDAEQELRSVKILELLEKRVGERFDGVVTGITKFGIFVQLREYLIDGLIRYEKLMDDYWEVDERAGIVRGRRTRQRIGIGDRADVILARVDVPRREVDLAIEKLYRGAHGAALETEEGGESKGKPSGRPARSRGKSSAPRGRKPAIAKKPAADKPAPKRRKR